ncbi:hypothetical protein [Aeromonas salmonicida]|uniref:hypothetical protein n=1 Tax=Aeromonas salmonicida TaxID=645 RepID=UPI003D079835
MERQTLQQQVPVYHVCQACGGAGCSACSDLCILDGDIQLAVDIQLPTHLPAVGQFAHCPGCSFIGEVVDFDIINYEPSADSDSDYLLCPVCGEEFR